jgi:large subunit ribosomal protein L21
MFAIVEIGGVQVEVHKKELVKVPFLKGEPGDTLEFKNVLMGGDEKSTKVGSPFIPGTVKAKIISQGKDDKILVFHKKRRKGYRKLNGHRQLFTSIEITDIKLTAPRKKKKETESDVATTEEGA